MKQGVIKRLTNKERKKILWKRERGGKSEHLKKRNSKHVRVHKTIIIHCQRDNLETIRSAAIKFQREIYIQALLPRDAIASSRRLMPLVFQGSFYRSIDDLTWREIATLVLACSFSFKKSNFPSPRSIAIEKIIGFRGTKCKISVHVTDETSLHRDDFACIQMQSSCVFLRASRELNII